MAKTFDQYATQLEKLVNAATDAGVSGVQTKMKAAHAALRKFLEGSDDRINGVIELDEVAVETMRALTLARLKNALSIDLTDQAASVARLKKSFSRQATSNLSAAASLRLEKAKAVMDSTASTVAEFRALAGAVDTSNPDGKKLVASIHAAIKAIGGVRKILAT